MKCNQISAIGNNFHSFIHSGYLYSAPSRNLLRGAFSYNLSISPYISWIISVELPHIVLCLV